MPLVNEHLESNVKICLLVNENKMTMKEKTKGNHFMIESKITNVYKTNFWTNEPLYNNWKLNRLQNVKKAVIVS